MSRGEIRKSPKEGERKMTLKTLEKTIVASKYDINVFTKLNEKECELLTTIKMDYTEKDNDKLMKNIEKIKQYGKTKVKFVDVNSATGHLDIDVVL